MLLLVIMLLLLKLMKIIVNENLAVNVNLFIIMYDAFMLFIQFHTSH